MKCKNCSHRIAFVSVSLLLILFPKINTEKVFHSWCRQETIKCQIQKGCDCTNPEIEDKK